MDLLLEISGLKPKTSTYICHYALKIKDLSTSLGPDKKSLLKMRLKYIQKWHPPPVSQNHGQIIIPPLRVSRSLSNAKTN